MHQIIKRVQRIYVNVCVYTYKVKNLRSNIKT